MDAMAEGDEDMAKQAQHIWSMLDNMANSDPAAYRKFIDKHVKEGKEFMKPPEPHMCVQTSFQKGERRIILYINICEWQRVPAPKTDQDPIPITGGSMYNIEGGAQALGIAFNPKVLEECGRDAGMREEQTLLIGLCLDYVDNNYKILTSRGYSLLPVKTMYKGNVDKLKSSLTSKSKDSDDKVELELEKAFGPAMKDSILQMTKDAEEGHTNNPSTIPTVAGNTMNIHENTKGIAPEIKLFPGNKMAKKGLIEELGTNKSESGIPEPEYELTEKDADEKRPRRFVLRVIMPDVSGVGECELDIVQNDLHLVVEKRYDLKLAFPEMIDDDAASAKFNRKAGILTVTLPILLSAT